MLISHQHRFLFVHVPKTAGLSIASALDNHTHHPERVWFNRGLSRLGININHYGPTTWRRERVHASAQRIRSVFGEKVFDRCFKFAFVRNPWDRLVSYYHYVSSKDNHHRKSRVQRLGGFREYLQYEARRNKVDQSRLLTDPKSGELLVDFVGRFENLADDFDFVCHRIGVEVEMPHRNASKHRDYRTYYDDETAEFVATHWAEDIERFGYTFDAAHEPMRTAS